MTEKGIIVKKVNAKAPCFHHTGMEEKLNGFVRWQKIQNGTLKDVCLEVKSLKRWIIATLVSIVLASGFFNYIWG